MSLALLTTEAPSRGQFLHVARFRTTDGENAFLCEEVLCHVVDTAVDEDNVSADIDEESTIYELFFLFVKELLELVGVGDVDFRVDFRLRDFEAPP